MRTISFLSVILITSLQTSFTQATRRNPFHVSSTSTSTSTSSSNNNNNNSNKKINNNHYQLDDDDDEDQPSFTGSGREFNIFGNRGGDMSSSEGGTINTSSTSPYFNMNRRTRSSSSRRNNHYKPSSSSTSSSSNHKSILTSLKEWITNGNLPKIQCRVEPNTTLKVRKTFRPLKTIVRLGADFNTQLGVWQFKSSWEDDVIGGKLTLAGRELQFSKTWLLSVGMYP